MTNNVVPESAKSALPQWAETLPCAITVADANCQVLFMNEQAIAVNHVKGQPTELNLRRCHNPRSIEIIDRMLTTGGSNIYTIEKKGVHKLIFQSAWRNGDGKVGGLVEISIVTPTDMPHFIRG